MKNQFLLFVLVALSTAAFAQAPQAFNYQAVARDAQGKVLANKNVSVRITILTDTVGGLELYKELHLVASNQFGLLTLKIGQPTSIISGTFDVVDWSTTTRYVKVEMDPNAGTNFIDMGTTQLLSVPYALYATSSGDWSKAGNNMSNSNSGNVGIGTTSPTAKLHVAGSFRLQDGTQANNRILTSDASGNATWKAPVAPTTIGFVVTNTTTDQQTVTSGSYVKVNWTNIYTEDDDGTSNINLTTDEFTVPETGWYLMQMKITWHDGYTGFTTVRLISSGSSILTASYQSGNPSSSSDWTRNVSEIWRFNAGQKITVEVAQNSGVSHTIASCTWKCSKLQ